MNIKTPTKEYKEEFFLGFLFSLHLLQFNQLSFWLFNIISPLLLLLIYKHNTLKADQLKIIVIFLTFLLWILLTGVLSQEPFNPLRKASEIFLCFLFLIGILLIISNNKKTVVFINGIIYSGILISLYIILVGIRSSFEIDFSTTLVSKNPSGMHLVISGMAIIFLSTVKKINLQYYFFYLIIGFALILTLSLKSIIIYFMMTFFLFIRSNKKIHVLIGSMILFIIFPILWPEYIFNFEESKNYYFVSNKFFAALGYDTNTFADNAVIVRQRLQQGALELFRENPFFGIGLENTRIYLGTYSHNNWIELLAGGGVLALVLFILPIGYIFLAKHDTILASRKRFLLSILIVVAILVFSQAQRIYDSKTFIILFSLLYLSTLKNLGNQ
ncbi:O-antigen ligase family protein [Thiofilum flexile]|uniref:O-antigen ligase family protein n=1 Tax=Thiofilum flexile TaxID=125627 RepID=UPI00035D0C98|nr:O-antigen ligase family protein [Thiofilum flexile]